MTDEPKHIANAAASLDDPYAALSQQLHGDGDDIAAGYDVSSDLAAKAMQVISSNDPTTYGLLQEFFEHLRTTGLIRLDDRHLCRGCYATHDFGDSE